MVVVKIVFFLEGVIIFEFALFTLEHHFQNIMFTFFSKIRMIFVLAFSLD